MRNLPICGFGSATSYNRPAHTPHCYICLVFLGSLVEIEHVNCYEPYSFCHCSHLELIIQKNQIARLKYSVRIIRLWIPHLDKKAGSNLNLTGDLSHYKLHHSSSSMIIRKLQDELKFTHNTCILNIITSEFGTYINCSTSILSYN